MSIWTQPSPSDYDRWVERLLQGEEPSAAADAVGHTCSAFRRTNPEAHAEALELSREARGYYADRKAEEWALAEDADDRMRERWLARWNPAYRKQAQLDIGGQVDIRTDVAAAIDRFTEAVAAAAVRGAAGGAAELAAGEPVGRRESAAGLPVGRVAGKA